MLKHAASKHIISVGDLSNAADFHRFAQTFTGKLVPTKLNSVSSRTAHLVPVDAVDHSHTCFNVHGLDGVKSQYYFASSGEVGAILE